MNTLFDRAKSMKYFVVSITGILICVSKVGPTNAVGDSIQLKDVKTSTQNTNFQTIVSGNL